jgi:hypothetical protein
MFEEGILLVTLTHGSDGCPYEPLDTRQEEGFHALTPEVSAEEPASRVLSTALSSKAAF